MNAKRTLWIAALMLLPVGQASAADGGGGEPPAGTRAAEDARQDASGGGTPAPTAREEAAQPEAVGFGGWKGKVVFGGDLPELPPLVNQGDRNAKDPAVCGAQAVPNERLVGEGQGVANVFIYLPRRPAGASVPAVPEEPVVFDQRGCVYIPHALVVRVNQEIRVLSDDPIPHNTRTEPRRNARFSEVNRPGDRKGITFKYSFAEPEPVGVKCDFHVWMQAYHLPLDHPFAAVSEADGKFEIQGLPAGTHEFRVWHEGTRDGFLVRNLKVTIRADEITAQDIDYPAEKFVAGADKAPGSTKLSSAGEK